MTREEFGKFIRRTRTRAAMTGKDLARAAGLSPSHVCLIERGKAVFSESAAVALEAALKQPAGRFVRQARIWQTPPDVLALLSPAAVDAYIERGLIQ